jgi:hypothetical protein
MHFTCLCELSKSIESFFALLQVLKRREMFWVFRLVGKNGEKNYKRKNIWVLDKKFSLLVLTPTRQNFFKNFFWPFLTTFFIKFSHHLMKECTDVHKWIKMHEDIVKITPQFVYDVLVVAIKSCIEIWEKFVKRVMQ